MKSFVGYKEYDTVIVTGTSGAGIHYEGIRGIVSTVTQDKKSIKIWPDDETIEDGKVWFEADNTENVVFVERDFDIHPE